MKKTTKVLLAIFTFLPLVLLIAFFGLFFSIFLENIVELERSHQEFPIDFIQSMIWFIILLVIVGLMSMGIVVYYIVHVNNNPEKDTSNRIIWTLILIFAGLMGSIVYYFVEIVPLKEPIDESRR